jgi:hypothetical protein
MKESEGYSKTPLARKLGFKEGFIVRIVNEPVYYFELLADLPDNVIFTTDRDQPKNLVHYFVFDFAKLETDIDALRNEIFPAGSIWISWPKKASRMSTNVTEDLIRNLALTSGLVDVKVCAIDAVWSGLKLVIPLKNRATPGKGPE